MPGPIVVATTQLLTYWPLAAEGFAPANCIPAVRESGATIVSHALDGALADVVEILEKKYC